MICKPLSFTVHATGEPFLLTRRARVDCYIVRIYRRSPRSRRALVGVVEEVGAEGKRAFTDRDELWRILTARRGLSPGKRRETS